MNASTRWPINSYGTMWRSATLWFDWSDETVIWEAIERVGLQKITARFRPVVIVGFDGDGWHNISDLRQTVQEGCDGCVVVDGRSHLDETLAHIGEDCGDEAWFIVLGMARLDVADGSTFEALMDELYGRWDYAGWDMPIIEF